MKDDNGKYRKRFSNRLEQYQYEHNVQFELDTDKKDLLDMRKDRVGWFMTGILYGVIIMGALWAVSLRLGEFFP